MHPNKRPCTPYYPQLPFCLLLLCTTVFANGGPSDGTDLWGSGNVGLARKATTRIVREDLRVSIYDQQADVFVKYRFSHDAEPQNIVIQFPVDYEESSDFAFGDSAPIGEVVVSMNDHQIPVGRIEEVASARTIKAQDYESTLKRKWYEFEVPFVPGTRNELMVEYSIAVSYGDWETNKDFFGSMSPRTFNYTFAPAMYWGDGVIDTLSVAVDASALVSAGATIEKVEPFTFSTAGGIYTYEAIGFKPGQSPDLLFQYDLSRPQFSQILRANRIDPSQVTSVTASSTLKGSYSPRNVLDDDFSTAWVEGAPDDGVGEWIELTFDELDGLAYIGIVNGYAKSKELYYANARIKRAKVAIHYRYENGEQQVSEYEHDCKDIPWSEYDYDTFISMVTTLEECGEGYIGRPVSRIRITVMDVYPGTKYDDLCISEVFIGAYRLGQ